MCYGLDTIPEGDWACDLCLRFGKKGKLVRCSLCSCRGGALRETNLSADSQNFQIKNPEYFTFANSAPPHKEAYIQTRFRLSLHYEPGTNQNVNRSTLTMNNLFNQPTISSKNNESPKKYINKNDKTFENRIENNFYHSIEDNKKLKCPQDDSSLNSINHNNLNLQKNFSFGFEEQDKQNISVFNPVNEFGGLTKPQKMESELFHDIVNNQEENEMEIEADIIENNAIEIEENFDTQIDPKTISNGTCPSQNNSKIEIQ